MQLTIRMPDEHYYKIEMIAKKMGLKKSDITRIALKKYLDECEIRENLSPYEKAKHLIGIAESGITDLGKNHRQYLIDNIKQDNQ
jgi:hypothetical protein